MYLFFDTETTGIPLQRRAAVTDLANWPRIVQLAFLQTDSAGRALASFEAVIRPEGFTIPASAAKIHGITTARARAEGIPVAAALARFFAALEPGPTLVAHNLDFDLPILAAEFLRAQLPNPFPGRPAFCTMQAATDFCAISGPYGFKWPTLAQLHSKLFSQDLPHAHSALADTQACAKCFFELQRRRLIP